MYLTIGLAATMICEVERYGLLLSRILARTWSAERFLGAFHLHEWLMLILFCLSLWLFWFQSHHGYRRSAETNPGRRSAMKGKLPKTVDEYLADIPEPACSTLRHIRDGDSSVVPKETTEVISYGIPMFKYNGMLVGMRRSRSIAACFQLAPACSTSSRRN